jgi:hypothetical protein
VLLLGLERLQQPHNFQMLFHLLTQLFNKLQEMHLLWLLLLFLMSSFFHLGENT